MQLYTCHILKGIYKFKNNIIDMLNINSNHCDKKNFNIT